MKRNFRWQAWMIAIIVVLAWEALARLQLISTLFFPAPTVICATLVRLAASGELLTHLGITAQRLALGFLIGGVSGLALGWLTGWFPALRHALDPFVAALHPLPKVALLPLLMVVFGMGERASILAVAAATFFPLMINTMSGVQEIPSIYFEVAQSFGVRPGTVFRRVILPGSLPSVLAGVRIALNVALLVTIAVELVSTDTGLGNRIWFAWEVFRTEDLWAYLAVISILGVTLAAAVRWVSRWLAPWRLVDNDARRARPGFES
jgi:NitT/TauT family transport system permease protein